MNYFDLHCDTLGCKYRKRDPGIIFQLYPEVCAKAYGTYAQVFAIYSQKNRTADETFENFLDVSVKIKNTAFPENCKAYLSVEGGGFLTNEERLSEMINRGVCLLTPVWGGENCLGGAHDTDVGMTEHGKKIITKCLENGILVDVSHSSDKFFYDSLELCEKYGQPMLATHSNSRAVYNHSRNLTDEMFLEVKASGGIAGISLCTYHLAGKTAKISDVIKHIEHWFSLGGEKNVAFGCDYDGIDETPEGLETPLYLTKIGEELSRLGYSEKQINGLFYDNASRFFDERKIKTIN